MDPYCLQPGMPIVLTRPGGEDTIETRLLGHLGQGANSQTWLAGSNDCTFAIKAPRFVGDDNELMIEQRIVQQFHHPSVIALAGVGVGPAGRLLLGYERLFANPLTLMSRPANRTFFPGDPGTRFLPLPPSITLNLAVDLFGALEHIHRRGFVHHDVKPDNLMARVPVPRDALTVPDHTLLELALEGNTEGVLVDLGSSRSYAYLAELNSGEFDADVLVVPPQMTPLHAPPEALLDNQVSVGPPRPLLFRSLDLYAAATTVYAMITGRAAYDHLGLDTASFEELRRVKEAERDGKLMALSSDAVLGALGYRRIADDLCALLAACTHRDPSKRPGVAGALQFVEELQRSFSPAAKARGARSARLNVLAATKQERVATFFGTTASDRAATKAWERRARSSPT